MNVILSQILEIYLSFLFDLLETGRCKASFSAPSCFSVQSSWIQPFRTVDWKPDNSECSISYCLTFSYAVMIMKAKVVFIQQFSGFM